MLTPILSGLTPTITAGLGIFGGLVTAAGFLVDRRLKRGQTRVAEATLDTQRAELVNSLQKSVIANGRRLIELQTQTLDYFNRNIGLEKRVQELEAWLKIEIPARELAMAERDAVRLELQKIQTECEQEQLELRRELEASLAHVHEKELLLVERTDRIRVLELRLAKFGPTSPTT